MTDALHCAACDSYDCAGFTRRLEPPPAPAGPGCSDAARQAAMTTIRAALDRRNR